MNDEYTDDFVPTFLNVEPAIILGLTEAELIISLIVSLLSSVLLAVPFFFLISFMVALVIFLALFALALMGFGALFRRYKIGKPRGYFQAYIKVKFGIGGDDFYIKDQPLIIGRSKKRVVSYE